MSAQKRHYHMTIRRLCAECGEQIPPARLAVVPTAEYCVLCQRKFDRILRTDDVPDAIAAAEYIQAAEAWG